MSPDPERQTTPSAARVDHHHDNGSVDEHHDGPAHGHHDIPAALDDMRSSGSLPTSGETRWLWLYCGIDMS
jgi:hypothetical protein